MKPKSAKMDPSSVPMAAQMGHGSPTCCSKCSLNRIFLSLGTSGTGFGSSLVPIGNEPIAILSKRLHSVPFCAYDSIPFRCTRLHCIVFHSILSGLPKFWNRMLLSALWLRKVCVVLFASHDARLLGQSWEELVLGDLPPSGCEKFV